MPPASGRIAKVGWAMIFVEAFPSVLPIKTRRRALFRRCCFQQSSFLGASLNSRSQASFKTLTLAIALFASSETLARDPDGRYAQVDPEMHRWFQQLKSEGGEACCALSDGSTLQDSDWRSSNGHYQVFMDEEWVDVPDAAVVTAPNRYGRTVLWPYHEDGHPYVRCFMPGSMT